MGADYTSTEYLNGVITQVRRVPSFFLNAFFRSAVFSDKEKVAIERKNGKPMITPYVHPMAEGKIIPGEGYTVDELDPAYLKDTRSFDPEKPIKRRAGEALGGSLSLEQRYQAIVAQDMQEMQEFFDRRKEIMAAEAIITGKLVVKGQGFDTTVDFKRPADHTVVLAGAEKWDVVNADGLGTANIKKQLETYGRKISKAGGGLAKTVIMDPLAWDLFSVNKFILGKETGALQLPKGSSTSLVVDPTILEDGAAEYKGSWGGFDFWVYQAEYVNPEDGKSYNVMPDKTMIMVGTMVEGTRYFGAIRHLRYLRAVESWVNSWEDNNPSREFSQLHSAPLMVPHRPYATMCITVA